MAETLALGIEEWRPLAQAPERYEVSSLGRVRSWVSNRGTRTTSPRLLVGEIDKDGYRKVLLSFGDRRQKRFVHSLVAQEFIGPCPDGLEVNHCDGVKSNNAVRNLEYVTGAANHEHAARCGLKASGSRNGAATLPRNILLAALELYSTGTVSQSVAAATACCSASRLQGIINGYGWRGHFPEELLARCRTVSAARQRLGRSRG